jgi:hypothetical protein
LEKGVEVKVTKHTRLVVRGEMKTIRFACISASATALSMLSCCVKGFSSPHPLPIGSSGILLASKTHLDDNAGKECCAMCARKNRCCSEDDTMHKRGQTKATPTIHTSRRKFVQFAATSSFAAFSSTACRAEYNQSVPNFSWTNNNIIAVETGPLAPFSSTREYRTIVLSNGEYSG